ncbi:MULTISPECIES: MlaD family protein [Paraburkholderia]|uniref:MlaD family protein n=1 Tax=Paraburkholderia TaxID=1822464 RepID=UPI00036A3969|nr:MULTISPECIES: MlaD family protein [Paraburkholderia]MDH6153712.1 phospholipid/cholesterol/gamma-HCH transport system substrate-binding protein [Paraburkholderia sp. WSM4179]
MKDDIGTKAWLAFVAFLLVVTVAGAGWYLFSASQYATYQIDTEESVSGLIADAPVEFHGVDVGKVKSIRLVNPHSVDIVLTIAKTAPVTSASVATITSRGLATRGFTGYVYISIEDVGNDFRPLSPRPGEPYPIIPTAPSKAVTLDTTINQVNENVRVITELLESILDKTTVASLKQSVDSLQKVTTVLAENTGKLNAIVANTERASHRFEPLLESSHDTVTALQTQILPEAHKALSNLDNLSRSVADVAARIDRDPSIVIRGTAPPAPGPGERK